MIRTSKEEWQEKGQPVKVAQKEAEVDPRTDSQLLEGQTVKRLRTERIMIL